MIWLHWDWVELASIALPLVVVVAALRLAGLSWVWAALAGAATAGVTYLAANELFDAWVRECVAENRTPAPPLSWPWSPRREFCDPGSRPALGGFATLAVPTLVALSAALLMRTRLRPVGFAVLAVLIPLPLLPEIYVTSLPYYRLDEYPILHDPVFTPAGESRPARACYSYGIALGPRKDVVVRPGDRYHCVDFQRTPEALSLTREYDEGRTQADLEEVGKKLTEKGLPVRPGDTGVEGLVVARAYLVSYDELSRQVAGARAADRRASYVTPKEPAACRGGLERADPPDDLADNTRVLAPRGSPAPDPRADLRALRLRSEGGHVCLAYEMGAELAGPMVFTFELRDSVDPNTFTQIFTARLSAENQVRVTSGADQAGEPLSVAAGVGLRGRVLTLVLDKQAFEAGEPSGPTQPIPATQPVPPPTPEEPPLERFAFLADVKVPLAGRRRVRDYFGPFTTPRVRGYPGGRPCVSDAVCFPPPPRPLTPHARRTKRALTETCQKVGGRVARGPTSPGELGCTVRYGGVPYGVPVDYSGRRDPLFVRNAHRMCRAGARSLREPAREIARARGKPIRIDRWIWHPSTAICEVRLRGELIRP